MILGKLLARESVSRLLIPFIFSVYNVGEHSMAHHDKVEGTPQRKDVRLNICIEGVVSRVVEPARFAAPAVKEHLAVIRQLFSLKVGKLDVEVLVEKQICGLDVAVKNTSSMDPRDCLGSLLAPGQPLLDRRWLFA